MRKICKCGSFAINTDPDGQMCDVCYAREAALEEAAQIADKEARDNTHALGLYKGKVGGDIEQTLVGHKLAAKHIASAIRALKENKA